MQLGNCIDVFLARHVSGTYAHHQEQWMLSCSIWFSAPSFWMGGGLESRCVGRVCGADVFLARHVSGTYAHHQEQWMLSCSIWFSAPSLWMGGGLGIRCVGRVYGADGTVRTIYPVSNT